MAEKEVKGIKKFFEEFKAFAMRGNVLDMAVGVVVGSAFTAIVNSLVGDVINPLIGLFFNNDFSEVVVKIGDVDLKIGSFISAIINFLIVAFVLFLVLGLPVSISLGLSSLVSFFYCGIPIVTIAQRLYTGMDSFPLMAIPLFILAGNLMTAGGISRKIVDFANILTGRVRGGLAYTAILACAIFAALSGSGPATTIAIGAMIYPSMKEIKYPEAQSAGLMAVAGGLGPVIPPSIIMVIYSTLVGCSVTNMFSAGIFWGIFTVIVLAGVVFVISRFSIFKSDFFLVTRR